MRGKTASSVDRIGIQPPLGLGLVLVLMLAWVIRSGGWSVQGLVLLGMKTIDHDLFLTATRSSKPAVISRNTGSR